MNVGSVVMMWGNLLPLVEIKLHLAGREPLPLEAKLDTGFTGAVSLPPWSVAGLELEPGPYRRVSLADGSERDVETLLGSVYFAEEWHDTVIHVLGTNPCIGMRLLRGANISFDAKPDGAIEHRSLDLPRPRWPLSRW